MRVCEGQGVECNGHDLAATHPSRWSTGWRWVVESRAPQCVHPPPKRLQRDALLVEAEGPVPSRHRD